MLDWVEDQGMGESSRTQKAFGRWLKRTILVSMSLQSDNMNSYVKSELPVVTEEFWLVFVQQNRKT